MKLLVLSGFSPTNKNWALKVKKNLKLNYPIEVIPWRHWSDSLRSGLSLAYEIEKILKKVGSDEVNIIGKSVGTRVAMHVVVKIQDKINKVILCGIPTKGKSESAKKTYSEGLNLLNPAQVICYQNTRDPLTNYAQVKDFIGSINQEIKVVEKPRSDHEYPYFEDFQKFLE